MTHPFSWLGGESLSKDLNRDGDDEGYFALHYIDSSKDIGIDDIYHVQEVSEDLQRFSINEHGFSLTSREEYAVESLEIQEESQEAGLSHSLAWQHGIRAGIRMTT